MQPNGLVCGRPGLLPSPRRGVKRAVQNRFHFGELRKSERERRIEHSRFFQKFFGSLQIAKFSSVGINDVASLQVKEISLVVFRGTTLQENALGLGEFGFKCKGNTRGEITLEAGDVRALSLVIFRPDLLAFRCVDQLHIDLVP